MITKNEEIKKRLFIFLVSILAAGFLSASILSGGVKAETINDPQATSAPDKSGIGVGGLLRGVLQRTYKFQVNMIDYLSKSLDRSDEIETRALNRITELKKQGKDVSALETMLDRFYDLIVNAEQAQSKAKSIINLHQGFDDQGKVIDLKLARDTIKIAA